MITNLRVDLRFKLQYQEPGLYSLRDNERGVDVDLATLPLKNGHGQLRRDRGEVYRIPASASDSAASQPPAFDNPDFDGSDLSTGSRQR